LSMVSPVTYSVASLIKRVFVIVFAVVWFGKPMTRVQAFGFVLTFVGLYLYDRTSDATKADKRAKALQSKSHGTLLPLSTDVKSGHFTASPSTMSGTGAYPMAGITESRNEKRDEGHSWTSEGASQYLPPGTKAEDTWRPNDMNGRRGIGVS
jgi:solute carrier family 35 protein E1